MACKTSFELYHNFPKLAEESGFTFNTHRPRVHIEWNKIRLVDIESLIRERKFVLIEQHVNDILDCVLESEFDVRILDEGVLKIFRLAQLAVEYQQFCRHYLDRSVYVLREEVTVLAQELESTKRLLKEKDEEIRKLKRRSKSNFRSSLPYGNDNIATMILKTLNNKGDIFPTLSSTDTMQHNKCSYCDKVFLNQLYLQSHMSRRHINVSEIPQKDVDNNQFERSHEENVKLNNELSELRSKLVEMERLVTNLKHTTGTENNISSKSNNDPAAPKNIKDTGIPKVPDMDQFVTNLKNTASIESKTPTKTTNEHTFFKEMKDAEVSTNGESYILDKIEEWKKEERDKYNKEINLLRTQVIAMVDSFKEQEKETTVKHDLQIMNELHATIKQQGFEILALKQELTNSRTNHAAEEIEQKKEIEAQMSYWVKRAELQSNEYKTLLQKLDVVAKEAEQSRSQAAVERQRVLQLQNLLQEKNELPKNDDKNCHKVEQTKSEIITIDPVEATSPKPKTNLIRDRLSFQKLQQKAQELLDIESTSTSDNSGNSSDEKFAKTEKVKNVKVEKKHDTKHKPSPIKQENHNKRKTKTSLRTADIPDYKGGKIAKDKSKPELKEHLHSKKENGAVMAGSPMKIIRAKITEEVNNRLVALGVDPLKTRLPENIFNKQKTYLQEQKQIKFKKHPGSEHIFHTLLASLDSNATSLKTDTAGGYYNSAAKGAKSFSLSSVISNVKSKALSLVKSNDHNKNDYKSYDSVAKKAIMLLRTPPSSTNSSPKLRVQNNIMGKPVELQNSKEKNGNNSKAKIRTSSNQTKTKEKIYESDTESAVSENDRENYINKHDSVSATIENLIKSPTRRPSDLKIPNHTTNTEKKNVITASISKTVVGVKSNGDLKPAAITDHSSDDVDSLVEHEPRRAYSVENITKLTKGVLKNASSTSSLNKKKVIFDMDAIQMKSVSASSPSQSVTEKSDNMEKYGMSLVNLDNEEWDISSIENEPVQKNPVISRTSPKIAELRETIESQLTRRNNTMSTALVGGVDVLSGPLLNKVTGSSKGGSNTSLGSSILDDTDSTPAQNQVALVKPRTFIEKDDSEIDISEFVTDELIIKNPNIIKT